MNRSLWIPAPMPGLNEIIAACERSPYAWGKIKKRWSATVKLYAIQQRFDPIPGPAHFAIELVEPNRKRDPDNVLAGALKITLDALRMSGLLQNDGWKHILSISPSYRVDKLRPGVRLTVTP